MVGILPIVISLVLSYLVFGDLFDAFQKMYDLRGKPTVTKDAVAALFLVLMFLLGVYGFLSTTLFSFLVWKVGERTLKVTEHSKQIEEKRDQEIVRESALIVYYDIERALSNLLEIYKSLIIKQGHPYPSRLFFSEDWNKNVATLRGHLLAQELRYLYRFYEDFFMLQSNLESWITKDGNDSLKAEVKRLADKYLVEAIPTPLILEFKVLIADVYFEEIMSLDLFVVFRKIHLATFPPEKVMRYTERNEEMQLDEWVITVNTVTFYKGGLDEIGKFKGRGQLYNSWGEQESGFSGEFIMGRPMIGSRLAFFGDAVRCKLTYKWDNGDREVSHIHIVSTKSAIPKALISGKLENGRINDGFDTWYAENGHMIYQGSVVNGYRQGQGTSYKKGRVSFSGEWEEDQFKNGTLYEKNEQVFHGEFKNGIPWNGEATKLRGFAYEDFTGVIVKGEPYSGGGYIFHRDECGRDFDDFTRIEEIDPEEEAEANIHAAEEFHARQNNELRRYESWEEYIAAEWADGKATHAEPVEENLLVKAWGDKVT